jgi:hypothetical protein
LLTGIGDYLPERLDYDYLLGEGLIEQHVDV